MPLRATAIVPDGETLDSVTLGYDERHRRRVLLRTQHGLELLLDLPEARVLAPGHDDIEDLARALKALGPEVVVITGGHREEIVDVFFDGEAFHSLTGERHPDGAAHGSGCTHSSALAAHLALGHSPLEAARHARTIASEAVQHGLRHIGRGAGPVDALNIAVRNLTARQPGATAP